MDIYERLKPIPNAHLLAVRDIFRDEGRYALVTEYADGGTLWDLTAGDAADGPRKAMDEATVKHISLAILDGLSALHENDIVHRDIKPENILVAMTSGRSLTSASASYEAARSRVSPCREPIRCLGLPLSSGTAVRRHPSADVYAVGRVIAFLLTGSVKVEDYSGLPANWWSIIKPCLSVNPDERPDVQTLRMQVAGLVA